MNSDRIFIPNIRKYSWIDRKQHKKLSQYRLYAHHGYPHTKIKGKGIAIHRMILGVTDSKVIVDHIDRNPLNNRRRNLRLCTRATNAININITRSNTSGFKGVSWHKKNSCWVAYIGKIPHVHLGSFKDKKEAARAYNRAAKKRYGKFASYNMV